MAIQQIEISPQTQEHDQVLTVHSSFLKGRGSISIYNAFSKKRNLPIIILLHGVYGGHWVMMGLGKMHKVYEALRQDNQIDEFVLVMPDDGSYYAGSAYLPLTKGCNAEKWIIDDVLSAVRENIECVSDSSNIYICGLSMGGYGALRLGCKYPEIFKGISAHSSITQIDDLNMFINEELSIYECENQDETSILYWMQYNREKLPPIRCDCGTEDQLYQSNERFKQKLSSLDFKVEFSFYPGGHEWSYWTLYFEKSFVFFDSIENRLS